MTEPISLEEMQAHRKARQEARAQQEMICDWLWQEMGLPQMFADMQQEWKRREQEGWVREDEH